MLEKINIVTLKKWLFVSLSLISTWLFLKP
jgi:hypothetical protein